MQPTRLLHPWDFPSKSNWSGVPLRSLSSRLNTQKRCPFHIGNWNAKVGSQEIPGKIWRNWQIWPWSTERSRAKTNRVLPRECTGHSKYPLPATQEMTLHVDITRRSILKSDGLYSLQPKMEKLYTVRKNKT